MTEVLRIPHRVTETASGEIIQVRDEFYILATSSRLDDRTRVLKHGESFAVFDRRGDIRNGGRGEQGLFVRGTRYLSRFELSLSRERLLLLSSEVRFDAPVLSVDLTNPDLPRGAAIVLECGRLHLSRSNTLREGAFEEHIEVTNFALSPAAFTLRIAVDADFADIFEVRGFQRERRGRVFDPVLEGGALRPPPDYDATLVPARAAPAAFRPGRGERPGRRMRRECDAVGPCRQRQIAGVESGEHLLERLLDRRARFCFRQVAELPRDAVEVAVVELVERGAIAAYRSRCEVALLAIEILGSSLLAALLRHG